MRYAAPLVVVALVSCGCDRREVAPPVLAAQTPEPKANAGATASALAGESRVLQLAIPVEVSASGVRILGEGRVIRAPRPQPGSGPQLVVTLEGVSADGQFQRQYELPDPRLQEIEGQGQRVAPRARTFVYVELSDRASRVDVKPKAEGPPDPSRTMEFSESANSTIELAKVASKTCTGGEYASSPMCQQLRTGK